MRVAFTPSQAVRPHSESLRRINLSKFVDQRQKFNHELPGIVFFEIIIQRVTPIQEPTCLLNQLK
jgi:hypothetical protein